MADVTVTAAEVLESGANAEKGVLGATVTAGQAVYLDSSTGTYKLADANASSTTANAAGIALTGGVTGQACLIAKAGSVFDPGFTVSVGAVYVVSATAGGIAPVADLATGWYSHILGVGITASSLRLLCINSGVAIP